MPNQYTGPPQTLMKKAKAAAKVHVLNPKQLMFAQLYAVKGNAMQCATEAGYSEKSAHAMGSQLLKKPEVQAEIARYRADSAAKVDVTKKWVTSQLLMLAQSSRDKGDHTNWHRAVDSLAKHIGYYEQDNQQKAPIIQIGSVNRDALRERLRRLQIEQGVTVEGEALPAPEGAHAHAREGDDELNE